MLLHFHPSHTASLLHLYVLLCHSYKDGSAASRWFPSLHQVSEMPAILGGHLAPGILVPLTYF